MRRTILPLIVVLCAVTFHGSTASVEQTSSVEAAKKPAETSVANVLGKAILSKDIHPDENDKTELRDYFAFAGLIVEPLYVKYVQDHKLHATAAEIGDFRKWWMTARRSDKGKHPAAKLAVEEEHFLAEVAKTWIERWKFHKSLYEKYGGRVIFQQAGLEPLDAYHDCLRDEEKAGHFQIHDPKWQKAFWEYYDPKHHRVSNEPDPFKTPLWKVAREK